MKLTPELEAEVVRLFHAENWPRGTIARHLHLHHTTVTRLLAKRGLIHVPTVSRRTKLDPYIPFIVETFEKFPKLNASRLYQMVKARGYTGAQDHFRHMVARFRPKPKAEPFMRLSTLPGEQAQCDWGYFGRVRIGKAEHRLLAFVMVLSYSRRIFLRFYLGDSTANFLRGHVDAFNEWNAVPREILYDNLKSAVVERVDSAIRFNERFLEVAAHYRFLPKPVAVGRPTAKGKVERAISYIRTAFFAAREFSDLNDLNRQAIAWCESEAKERKHVQDRSVTVWDAFLEEAGTMLPLPADAFCVYERLSVRVGKTPYVRFCGNDYSVPHKYVRRSLLLEANTTIVRLVDGVDVVAEHLRSWDKGQLIEKHEHVRDLLAYKKDAIAAKGKHRILSVLPSGKYFLERAAERGSNMGRLTQSITTLLEMYGASEVEFALSEALACGKIHSQYLREVVEKRRSAQGLPPPTVPKFSSTKAREQAPIMPNSLDSYDMLLSKENSNDSSER
jgi:transposase